MGGRQMKKIKSSLLATLMLLCLTLMFVGCGQSKNNALEEQGEKTENAVQNETTTSEVENKEDMQVVPIETTPVATIVVKDYGTITVELYPQFAPNTVNNFITLANDGFYDGLTFHRVVKDFMIQGGDPDGTGTGGPGYSIAGEFADNDYTQNTLSHEKGVISMARTMDPNSAGSQFFITSADSTYLDNQYAAFGKVTSGIEVVDAIQSIETDSNEKPITEVVIESIRVETNGVEVPEVVKIEK